MCSASSPPTASRRRRHRPTTRPCAAKCQRSTMRMMIDGEPGFLIHPQCKIARVGLAGGFKYRKLRGVLEGITSAKRDKNMYSHVVEAGEYMMLAPARQRS